MHGAHFVLYVVCALGLLVAGGPVSKQRGIDAGRAPMKRVGVVRSEVGPVKRIAVDDAQRGSQDTTTVPAGAVATGR
ncbi:hypothetical protein B0H19DRAFT_472019 [Mycena capillaripes]|nr:hypothetical protein B0H19DRAFT_472019 [Mycena capillaripes]